MYPGDFMIGQFFGFAGFGLNPNPEDMTSAYNVGYTYWTDFIFQGMFAATRSDQKDVHERFPIRR